MDKIKANILWIDGIGGLSVGVLVLLLHQWLSNWYGLSPEIMKMMGMTNLVYGCYSSFLAKRCECSLKAIVFLVFANLMWTLVCIFLLISLRERMTMLGQIVVLGEGVYVGLLGSLEWFWRKSLVSSACELTSQNV